MNKILYYSGKQAVVDIINFRIIQRVILPLTYNQLNYQDTFQNFQNDIYDMELNMAIQRSLE